MRQLAVLSVVVVPLAVPLFSTPDARAQCVGAVFVDGHVLVAVGLLSEEAKRVLPARRPSRQAVAPACNDAGQDESDGTTRVHPLQGLPATVAVTSVGNDELYLASGSLTAIASHPLHQTVAAAHRLRRPRALDGCQPRNSVVQGALESDAHATGLRIQNESMHRTLIVDERTRLLRRPVWTPLLSGQRVAVTVTACGSRHTARSIRTVGRFVKPELAVAHRGSPRTATGSKRRALLIGLAAALLAIGTVAAGWCASRPRTSR